MDVIDNKFISNWWSGYFIYCEEKMSLKDRKATTTLREAIEQLTQDKVYAVTDTGINTATALVAIMEALERIEGLQSKPEFVCPHGTKYYSYGAMRANCGKFTENTLASADCKGEYK